MDKQPAEDDPDSPRGNIVEDFKYFFKEVILDVYNFKKHPILAVIMLILLIVTIIGIILSMQLLLRQ